MDYMELYLKEKKRRKQEKKRRKQADERRKQAEERLQHEQHENQNTTFEEFIECCHTFLSEPLKIETDRDRTTKGSLTNPAGRCCPTYLRPWSDFHSLQQQVFDCIYRFLQPPGEAPSRLLPSRRFLKDRGDSVCRNALASEADLVTYEQNAVQDQVYQAITALRSIPAAQEAFHLGTKIDFENTSHAIENSNKIGSSPNKPIVDETMKRRRSNADQYCVHHVENRDSILLYTIEYKPAHKLSADHLRHGLREMDFWDDVVQRATVPTDDKEKVKYDADRFTGFAVAQVYDGMIRDGVAHACLTNGLCKVFFHVRKDNPETIYYFLSEPNMDVLHANDEARFRQSITSVGRMLGFCLMSIGSTPRCQTWRHSVASRSKKWEIDSEPVSRSALGSASASQSNSTGSEWIASSCGSDVAAPRASADSSDSDSNDAPSGPSNASGRKRNLSQLSSSSEQEPTRRSKQRETETRKGREHRPHSSWQYCTQSCLIALRNKGYLDVRCPNVRLHRCGQKSDRHLIDSADLARLIKQQLATDLDNYCTPWGMTGIRGAPFKLTLASHGYTFVGKGTTDFGWKEVRREADVYRALQRAQGSSVPVFLGIIDLEMAYFLRGGVDINHMLLMSWGGEQVDQVKDEADLWEETKRSIKEIHDLGVEHGDLHEANMLWNSEFGRVQIIDFHRSKLVGPQVRRLKRRLA